MNIMKPTSKFQLCLTHEVNLKIAARAKARTTGSQNRDRSSSNAPYGAVDTKAASGTRTSSASNSKSRERPVRGPSGPNAVLKLPKTNLLKDKSLINMQNLNKRVTFLEAGQPKVP